MYRELLAVDLPTVLGVARAENLDIRQARAQVDSSQAEVAAAEAELQSARADLARFEALLASNAGSRKQRDDAASSPKSPKIFPISKSTKAPKNCVNVSRRCGRSIVTRRTSCA